MRLGLGLGLAVRGRSIALAAPANTVAPVASGTATTGNTLSCTDGTWTGNPAPSFTYQWKRNGVDIGGATANSYVVVSGDNGTTLTCAVTGTNSEGSATAASNGLAASDPSAVALAAVVAGFASAPDATRQGHMGDFISALMNAGVWSDIDVLHVYAATEDQGSRVNWVNPGTFNATKAGSSATPTFAVDQGWTSAANSHLASGYTLSTSGGKFVRNDGHMFVGCLTDANGAASTFLCGATSYAGIQPRTSAGVYSTLCQSSGTDAGSANTGKGLYGWSRTASGTYDRYKNGSVVDSPSRASTALPATEVLVLTHNGSNLSSKVVSFFCMGRGLNSTKAAAINTAYAAYMNAIGTSPT